MHAALVTAQFTLIAVIAFFGRLSQPLPVPVGLMAAGFVMGLWAIAHNRPGNFNIRPRVRDDAKLITTGPYRLMRHPMYTALIVACAGMALNGWSDPVGALAFAGLVLVLAIKMGVEEKLLAQHFADYRAYAQRTARLFPGIL